MFFSITTIENSSLNRISNSEPDLIIYNGTIITMDLNHPQIEAVAVSENKIVKTGSEDSILPLADESTVHINLEGTTMVPGFIDSHSHWIGDRNLYNQNTP